VSCSEFETDQRDKFIADFIHCQPPERSWSLIQRNLTPTKSWSRGYLAFDKCTLLSSQGSDAPTTRPSQPGPQGNFSILPRGIRLSNRRSERTRCDLRNHRATQTQILTEVNLCFWEVVRHLRGAEPWPFLNPVGRTSNNLRRLGDLGKSRQDPGRVTLRAFCHLP
jgi:hypothetical protein